MFRLFTTLATALFVGCVVPSTRPTSDTPPPGESSVQRLGTSVETHDLKLCCDKTAVLPGQRDTATPPAPYYPTTVGSKWVYQVGNGSHEVTDTVIAVESSGGSPVVTVQRVSGKPVGIKKVRVTPSGLFLVENDHGPAQPEACLLRLPHTPNERWDSRSPPLDHMVETAGPVERVEVPAGTFMAIRVDSFAVFPGAKPSPLYTHWYAPGVGVVKSVMASGDPGEMLKSFTPGK